MGTDIEKTVGGEKDADKALVALTEVLDRATKGDKSTVPAIREAIMRCPNVVEVFGGNLAKVALDSFVDGLAGKDLVFRETLIAKMAALRGELIGPNPTAIERLLVERVVACWLQVQDADVRYAQAKNASFRQADFNIRRMNSAHKRYLSALKALALIRKMAIPALQINIARRQVNQLNTVPQDAGPAKDC